MSRKSKFNTVEELNLYLNRLSNSYNRNYYFNLKELPKLKDTITGYCLDKDEFGNIHGEFKVRLDHFLNGRSKGCKKCSGRYQYTTKEYIKLLEQLYPYDRYHFKFDKVNYIDKNHKITITCEKHGDFEVWPDTIKASRGKYLCAKCMHEELGKKRRLGTDEFIRLSKELHGEKYHFEKTNYVNSHTKVTVSCSLHGEFSTYPYDFLSGSECCPLCKKSMSNGEYKIFEWLTNNNFVFDHCKYVINENIIGRNSTKICPDFILSLNGKEIWIEYNGEQHYNYIDFFHNSYEDFLKQLKRDQSEKEYCLKNDIKLIIISYLEYDNIEDILSKEFNIIT